MKTSTFLLLLILFFHASSQAQHKGFVVIGQILGADSLKQANMYRFDTGQVDTVTISNGQFIFTGNVKHPAIAVIGTDKLNRGHGVWLSNDTIRVTFKVEHQYLQPQEVIGPSESVDYLAHIKLINHIFSSKVSQLQQNQQINEFIQTYVSTHPDSYYSVSLLGMHMRFLGAGMAKELYAQLSPAIRNTDRGQHLATKIHTEETNALSKVIEPFSLPDQHGILHQVSTVGKPYTLLCFWSSWCGPCRVHNRDLIKLSQRMKDKCQLISISMDTDQQAWLKAIEKDQLTWLQLSDLKGGNSPVIKYFVIQSVPYYLLVNEAKQIVATNLTDARQLLEAN